MYQTNFESIITQYQEIFMMSWSSCIMILRCWSSDRTLTYSWNSSLSVIVLIKLSTIALVLYFLHQDWWMQLWDVLFYLLFVSVLNYLIQHHHSLRFLNLIESTIPEWTFLHSFRFLSCLMMSLTDDCAETDSKEKQKQ